MRFPLIIGLFALVAACGSSESTPPDADNPPPLKSADAYVTHVETAVFEGPIADVIQTLQTPDSGVLAFTEPTEAIPEIVDLELLDGNFPESVGDTRRVTLANGHYAVERVLENSESAFRYQVWNLTAPAGRAVDHIVGEFFYEEKADRTTLVTWRYNVTPRIGLLRPFVSNFVDTHVEPFMASGLGGAAAAYNSAN